MSDSPPGPCHRSAAAVAAQAAAVAASVAAAVASVAAGVAAVARARRAAAALGGALPVPVRPTLLGIS